MTGITNVQIRMTNESQQHCVCRNAAECDSLGHRPGNQFIAIVKALNGRNEVSATISPRWGFACLNASDPGRCPGLSHFVPLARIALLFMFALISSSILAQEKPPIRMKMELMSIRNRSSGPLPVHIKLEYNKPQILEGDLELAIYDSVDVISPDDLMASLRYEDIVLAGEITSTES